MIPRIFNCSVVVAALATQLLSQSPTEVSAFVPSTTSNIHLQKRSTYTVLPKKQTQAQTTVFLSDIPQDETEKKQRRKTKQTQQQQKEDSNLLAYFLPKRRWSDYDWWPEPPEDQLTLGGDILSLFLYCFSDRLMQTVFLNGVLHSSTSAADAAKTLDPSGTEITVSAPPVWLDPTALGPHVSDQVLFWDLQDRVTPHFTPILSSAGMASVALASCWLLAGCLHKAFHMRNTLDCPTERVMQVTGQAWITSSILMILLACASQHWLGDPVMTDAATQAFSFQQGDIINMNPIQQWFSVLSINDFDFIVNSLGVLLIWRFLISYLVGGWSK